MRFNGVSLCYVLDGCEGWQACYEYAGIVSANPYHFTLRELWRMQLGKRKLLREHALNQALMVWGIEDMDITAFLITGAYHKARTTKVAISEERNEDIKKVLQEAKNNKGIIIVHSKPQLPTSN